VKDRRFDLVDRIARVTELDEQLGERLAKETQLRRALVARVSGVEEAFTEQYRKEPTTGDAVAAYKAGDELHRALGEVGAEYVLGRLRQGMAIGLASGRGVGFTIIRLSDLARNKPSWVSGYDKIQIWSLCGGAHVGTWATQTPRDLDADENAFALGSILGIPRGNVHYMYGWVSAYPADKQQQQPSSPDHLDQAVVGLGQLNTRHHFLRHRGEDAQLDPMAEPLRRITEWQEKEDQLVYRVAEIGHTLFPVGGKKGLPEDFLAAINEINEVIRAVSPKVIMEAGDVVLVAGGTQKLKALAELAIGECPDAPVDLSNLTLVTDRRTAEEMLDLVGTRGRNARGDRPRTKPRQR